MTTKRWYQDWLGWVIVGSIAYGIIALISLATDVGRPFPGFLTYYNLNQSRIEMEWNTPSWWWFQDEDWPTITDTITSVEDVPFNNLTTLINEQNIYEKLTADNKQSLTIQIRRGNDNFLLNMPLRTFSWQHYVDITLGPFILSGSLLLLAVILYRISGAFLVQRIAILIFIAIAALTNTHSSLFLYGQFRDHFLGYSNQINAIAALFIGPLLFHFAFHYPTSIFQSKHFLSKIPVAVYSFALVPLCSYFLSRLLINIKGISPQVKLLDSFALESVFYFLIIGVGAILLRMISDGFFRSAHPRAYREARIMLTAFLFALPSVWFAAYGAAGSGNSIANMYSLADPRYFILAVPLAFATITLRYYPNPGLNKWLLFVWTLTASSILANVVLIILFYKNPEQIGSYLVPPMLLLLIIFFILGLITNWQNSWRGWLGRLFNWERINYRAVHQFGHALAVQPYTNLSQLAQNIVATLHHELSLEWAACWLTENNHLQLAAVNGRLHTSLPQIFFPPVDLTGQPLRLITSKPDWLQPLSAKATVVLPLLISDRLLGILVVGPRWDAPVFDDRDLEILDLIAQQAALFLHNAQQMERVRAADKQMLQIQENARRQIAQDLHDYILPSLGQLPLTLQTGLNYLETSPERTRPLLEQSIERLQENAGRIRRIQQSLVIRPLQYGLAVYLEEMAQRFRQQTGVALNLTLPPNLDEAIPNHASRELIYAVWQQALDNVQAHARASRVEIVLILNDHTAQFSICDDGVGVSPQQREQAAADGRFGLQSMQTRLENTGGQFEFDSAPGQGTRVKGELPLP